MQFGILFLLLSCIVLLDGGNMKDFNTNDAMVDMFLFETYQLLEQLEQVILSSEGNCCYSREDINEVFRIMHTIKGSSAMMMYNGISALAHAIEDLFSYIRKENPEKFFSASLNDLIFDCIDFVKIELEKISNHDKADGNSDELVNRIQSYLSGLKKNGFNMPDENTDKKTANFFKAVIYFEDGCEMENIRAFAIINNLEKIAYELKYYPQDIIDNDGSVETIRRDGFQVFIRTDKTRDEINDCLMQTVFIKGLELTSIDEKAFSDDYNNISDADTSLEAATEEQYFEELDNQEVDRLPSHEKSLYEDGQKHQSKEHLHVLPTQSIISVSVAKLDKLMDLVGEMVIAEAMVLQNPDLEGLELNNFNKAASQLSKLTSEIQDIVMSVRMVPLSATFQRMNRIVRDMCRKLDKEVNLEIVGEETEVDKNIIERITDPLMHLVRNAVDHGIEPADERLAAGKPKFGKITLEAKNVGNDVHIIVRDDGKGLDREKILGKARENNLLPMNEADLTDSEVYKLIMMPGFSTRDNVTEFSGRGVGMDVVAKNIESIGGSISIDSEKGKGTQITLKIPLTLAIIDGMNLQVGKSTFTIPTITIQESFRPKGNGLITDPDGNEMIMVRGQCYPIIRLHKLYNLKTDVTDLTSGIITMVSQDGKTVCIFSDRLLGQQQVVVKSLPEYLKRFKKVNGISGCTLLGDGSISLILDIASLINSK